MRIALMALTAFLFSKVGIAADRVYHCNMWNSVVVSSDDPRAEGVIREKPQKFKFSLTNPYADHYEIEFFKGGYFDGLTLSVLKQGDNDIHAVNRWNTQIMRLNLREFRFVSLTPSGHIQAISGYCERVL